MKDQTASETLDAIRRGGTVAITRTNLLFKDFTDKLEGGDFPGALTKLNEMSGWLRPLAEAQGVLGSLGHGYIATSDELKVGMKLINIGEIEDLEEEVCGDVDCNQMHRYALIKDAGRIDVMPGMQWIVEYEDES